MTDAVPAIRPVRPIDTALVWALNELRKPRGARLRGPADYGRFAAGFTPGPRVDTSRAAIVEGLGTIRTTLDEMLNQTDYQGTPVFDDGQSTLVPVSRGLNLAVVGTRQEVSEGIDVNGAPMSINDVLSASISAIQSGVDADIATSLDGVKAAQAHITVEQAKQGVRSDRLEVIGDRLTDVDIDLTERRADLESTDLQQVISRLQSQLLQLEAAQSAYARINQKTLFDIIG